MGESTYSPAFYGSLTNYAGSVVLPHLTTGWHVDQAILSEDERLVVIRFGRDSDPDCMRQDEVLYRIQERVRNFAAIYVCDIDQVPDFNTMYELYDPCTILFFFRNKHMMVDFGTGNNNKLNWVVRFNSCSCSRLLQRPVAVPLTPSSDSSRTSKNLLTSSRLCIEAQRRAEVWLSARRVSHILFHSFLRTSSSHTNWSSDYSTRYRY